MEETIDLRDLAEQVLALAHSRLTADLRFLSAALERLRPSAVTGLGTAMATDGHFLYYDPAVLLTLFKAEQHTPARYLLHLTIHCLLGHPFQRQERDIPLWNLACDIAAEEVIRELDILSVALSNDREQDDWRMRLKEYCPHMTAEELYNCLLKRRYDAETLQELQSLFFRDAHNLWRLKSRQSGGLQSGGKRVLLEDEAEVSDEPVEELAQQGEETDETEEKLLRRRRETLRKEWKQLAKKAETDLQTFSRRHGKRAGALMDSLAPITFEEVDYGEFLRRFGTQNEVMQLSDDAFDLIYYTYGLKKYGNVPLIEPLEFRDEKRIREFVIAIDTSGSVQGDIVQSFLQKTCDVLRQSGSFTSQVNIYLIQCDAEVQSVDQITTLDQLNDLIPKLRLKGFGGTDFRPVFEYVDRLLEKRILTNLNGLLYFTDGVGTYPEKAPDYKTAFIFNRDDCISPHVPSWAIRAVLTTDNIRLLETDAEEEN